MRTDRFTELLGEYDAVRLTLASMRRSLQGEKRGEATDINRRDLGVALQRIEGTFLVRFMGVFELELETTIGRRDLKLARLVEHAATAKNIDSDLVNAVEAYRVRRNGICHRPDQAIWAGTALDEVSRDLRKFIGKCSR